MCFLIWKLLREIIYIDIYLYIDDFDNAIWHLHLQFAFVSIKCLINIKTKMYNSFFYVNDNLILNIVDNFDAIH